MKINFEGRTWDYDPDVLDVKQAMVLHMTYGLTIKAWSNGFPELDQRSYAFAYWHMLQQNGIQKPIADCNPNIIDWISVYVEAQQAEAEEAAAKRKAEAEAEVQPAPFPQPGPPLPKPATPTDTTPPHRARRQQPTAS